MRPGGSWAALKAKLWYNIGLQRKAPKSGKADQTIANVAGDQYAGDIYHTLTPPPAVGKSRRKRGKKSKEKPINLNFAEICQTPLDAVTIP